MLPLAVQATAAVVVAAAGAVALYLFLAWLLGVDPHPETASGDQQQLLADLVKIALGLAAGIGAAVALIVGYRRARVEEAASHRDDQRLFASRYQDAADLIGNDKAAVRLAGIYAMSRLADDWAEQRQQCIDVLCAYLRLPYDPDASEPGEREVRLTVIRLIAAHLQPDAVRPWHGHDFDFTGAVFDGGDFSYAVFSGAVVHFSGAKFSDGEVSFGEAQFADGVVHFTGAKFSGSDVDFGEAQFGDCVVVFGEAVFSGGEVSFLDAEFSGGAAVDFNEAEFSGSDVDFGEAQFADGATVNFIGAKFSGGEVIFSDAQFSGATLNFYAAVFSSGTVDFSDAQFTSGKLDLSESILVPGGTPPQGLPEPPAEGLKLPAWLTHSSPGAPSAADSDDG